MSDILNFPQFQVYSSSFNCRSTQFSSISRILHFPQFQTYSSFLNVKVTQVPPVSGLRKFKEVSKRTNNNTFETRAKFFLAVMKAELDERGDNTGSGPVILVCIRLERVAVWISTGFPTNFNSAASQEIPHIYRTRRSIRAFTGTILTHSNLVHASSSKFLKINFNIILPSTTKSPKCTSSLGSPHQNPVCNSLLSYALYAPPIPSFLI